MSDQTTEAHLAANGDTQEEQVAPDNSSSYSKAEVDQLIAEALQKQLHPEVQTGLSDEERKPARQLTPDEQAAYNANLKNGRDELPEGGEDPHLTSSSPL